MLQYLPSIFSWKKFLYRDVSPLAFWDRASTITQYTSLQRKAKLMNSHVGRNSRICINTELFNTTVGNFSIIARNCIVGLGAHPTNTLSPHSIFYKKNIFSECNTRCCKQININIFRICKLIITCKICIIVSCNCCSW